METIGHSLTPSCSPISYNTVFIDLLWLSREARIVYYLKNIYILAAVSMHIPREIGCSHIILAVYEYMWIYLVNFHGYLLKGISSLNRRIKFTTHCFSVGLGYVKLQRRGLGFKCYYSLSMQQNTNWDLQVKVSQTVLFDNCESIVSQHSGLYPIELII